MQLDRIDPLAHARERFSIPDRTIYLDGNSLGALPANTAASVERAMTQEWGRDLIRSWNTADWVNLPESVGARLAPMLGAKPDEVIVTDSTSVNIFKLLSAILASAPVAADARRRVVLSEKGNFPTDLYIAQGLIALLGNRYELKLVERHELANAFDDHTAVALITHVDYRSGDMLPMAALNTIAKNAGANILWDLSHSTGAVPLDFTTDGTQYAVGCGYKYLNGGPGAPAYVYVRTNQQSALSNPIAGWFGHAAPFAFDPDYRPATDIRRFLTGTPSVLATVALAEGIATFDGIDLADVRRKSLALSDLFWSLMEVECEGLGFGCISPRDHPVRASHLSFAHEHAYPIMQAIIERGVIGDFRQPNLLRFGFTPLYTRFVDCWDAVATLRDVVTTEAWREARFQHRNQVT